MIVSPNSAQLPSMRSLGGKGRGRPPKPATGPHRNNLLALRLRLPGPPTQADVAAAVGLTEKTYGKRERGQVKITDAEARLLARYFRIEQAEITGDLQDRSVRISGYVGAGAEVYPIDDGADFGEVECPRGIDPRRIVAVEVRGDSMFPLIGEGWVLFYTRVADSVPHEAVGQMCVVKLAGGGPMLVKWVQEGRRRGRYDLLSANTNARPIQDVALEWAAPVRAYVDPELAGRRPN